MNINVRKALTVAGSDPSGGAGIQADLKTFSALGVYGMSVISSMTVQNTTGVLEVMEVDPEFIGRQLDALFTDLPPDAVKTGMLLSAPVIGVLAERFRRYGVMNLVVDPVMTAKSGTPLLEAGGIDALRRTLLPLARIVTPNLAEAQVLAGSPVQSIAQMEEAAKAIHAMGTHYVLVKGGHLAGDAVDVLFDGTRALHLAGKRIETRDSHGTGCVMSAAITAGLALGKTVEEAVHFGKKVVTEAIQRGLRIGQGQGPCDPLGLGRKGDGM
jgi:hydroxymethylpyrimidine/phosphomethylpyrimidine kinase